MAQAARLDRSRRVAPPTRRPADRASASERDRPIRATLSGWLASRLRDASDEIVARDYALAAMIEHEAGMEGYDPQVGRPISEPAPQQGVTVMSATSGDLRRRFGNDS
ncbi:hypothetical protein [Streptomyces sp. NPDC001068]|uniref:hypothetical protein n=1 Tax=Streptomyces sp. NPDC001068 TaxID=3364544 RepID=UPI00369C7281